MDSKPPPPLSARIAATEKLYNEAELGVSADTVLRAVDPMIERRLGHLLDKLAYCPPELGALLEVKAQISEVWRMRREILEARARGRSSWDTLQAILVTRGGQNGTKDQSVPDSSVPH